MIGLEITDVVECNGVREGKYGVAIARCRGAIAGVFTRNKAKAAPVIVCERNVEDGVVEGLIVNSGNANAFTGEEGLRDAERMCEIAAKLMKCDVRNIAIASTGVIGRKLDMEVIERLAAEAYRGIGRSEENAVRFGNAIRTTDRFVKKASRDDARIAAVAKGAGMIAPNMATMLCFVFTTAKFDAGEMKEMLRDAVSESFNRLTVDGDTSTNDTVLLISTGRERVERDLFEDALKDVCFRIAKQMARDGEGATKVFEVRVRGAIDDEEAERVAKAVASSLLVKTAVFGCDPNWGRIVAAVGYSCSKLGDMSISFSSDDREVVVVSGGRSTGKEEEARSLMKENDEFAIEIDLGVGGGEGVAIGCDLTYDYVRLNSEYTT